MPANHSLRKKGLKAPLKGLQKRNCSEFEEESFINKGPPQIKALFLATISLTLAGGDIVRRAPPDDLRGWVGLYGRRYICPVHTCV